MVYGLSMLEYTLGPSSKKDRGQVMAYLGSPRKSIKTILICSQRLDDPGPAFSRTEENTVWR